MSAENSLTCDETRRRSARRNPGRCLKPHRFGGLFAALILACGSATPQQWESSLASTASLRTGGAELVSSDALETDSGNVALITYWEMRTDAGLDVYRCIDVVDSTFRPISQECWKALRPAGKGRRAARTEITSSDDICESPDDPDEITNVAYCSFSQSYQIRTPYFSLIAEPLGAESRISVSDEGRALAITRSGRTREIFFDVRVDNRGERRFFADTETTAGILELVDEETQCELRTISNRQWAACRSNATPSIATYYLVQDELLYEVSFDRAVPNEIRERLDRMLTTIDPSSEQD